MAVVVFSPDRFRAERPQFAALTDGELNAFFQQAELFVRNDSLSPVPYDPPGKLHREILLNLLVCHLAQLDLWSREGRSGTMTAAGQGDVSVSFSPLTGPSGSEWYNQTQCGQTYWQLSRRYLDRAVYFPGLRRRPSV